MDDVENYDGDVEVSIKITINNKSYNAKDLHIEGDYGRIRAGIGKKAFWDVTKDFPRGLVGEFDYKLSVQSID